MHRKTMRKLALIQWACFQNEVTSLDGSVLFTGVNGSGKSTILDAVTYLLTANTQFNLAAKDRDRTVKAYVRGDTKSNGKDQFLRTGEVVSYLAAEFYGETDGNTFVIGVCIESPNAADRCSPSWFILRDTELSDVRMAEVKDNVLVVYPRRQMTVKGNTLKMTDFLARDKARAQILRVLGLRCDPEKYRMKLVKMMAFNPENNIDQFIQNSVLEPGNVSSLQELRTQKNRFEELRGIYENLKISRDKLETVEEKTAAFESEQRLYRNRRLMAQYQEMLYYKDEKEIIAHAITALENRREGLSAQRREMEEKRNLAQERYDSARSNSDFADVKASIDAIDHQLRVTGGDIENNRQEILQLKQLFQTILSVQDVFPAGMILEKNGEKPFAPDEPGYSADAFRRHTEDFIDIRETYLDVFRKQKYETDRELDETKGRVAQIRDALQALERRKIPYPQGAVRVREILAQELKKQYPDAQVRFFAELVQEIKDDSFRMAIETFLGRKRFYLIVDDRYVESALRIMNNRKLHDTNLVMSDKLPDADAEPGTAAGVLSIPNSAARKYANYLLNGIALCDSIEELHAHPKGGLMRDGMLAKSYAAAMMDMRNTQCYMGAEAVELQTKAYQKELTEQEAKKTQLLALREDITAKIEVLQKADVRTRDYDFFAPFKLAENKAQFAKILEEKKKLEMDPGFRAILEEVNRAKNLLNELTGRIEALDMEKGRLENELQSEREKEKTNAGDIFTATNRYEEYREKHPELEREMKADYERLRTRSENARVIKQGTVERQRSNKEQAQREMENAQLDYLRTAGMNLEKRGVSFISFFREERNQIANVKIEEAQNKLEAHAREMETTFMTDFVSEMNESILAAKREVEQINRELKRLPFGDDTYTFVMDEREDRRDFFRICEKLNDFGTVEMLQSMNAEDEELSHDIAGFMEKILSEPDESEFTDYRKYFKYDMKIRTRRGDGEVEANFSKKQGSASNGEKQTPYFIILAASLMQCYPRNTECARLAFIDEAFAALSRERIEQMVKYLEDNHFQVLYAAPPEKIASIGDLIQTTVSLVTTGRYTRIVEGLTNWEM